jgi:hypothetical protein
MLMVLLIVFGAFPVFSQSNTFKYIELIGSVDMLGNIIMMPITGKNKNVSDTSINYKIINSIIAKSKNAIGTINLLSKEGWYLVSAINVSKDDNGRPNTPYLAYYFKKEQ